MRRIDPSCIGSNEPGLAPTSMSSSHPMLKVTGLKVAYGGIQAVKGISFEVREGELVSLIGANGAGKTTRLKAVTGLQPVADGDIEYLGRSIRGQGAWDLVRQGLVMVPEGRGTFARMTITENLQMGAFVRKDDGIDADIDMVFGIFPRLKERRNQLAGTMSGGEQQMLAMGRALDGTAQAAAARRAVDGTLAHHGRQDLRSRRRHLPARRDGAARRAEREPRAATGKPRLCDGVGRDHDGGAGPPIAG